MSLWVNLLNTDWTLNELSNIPYHIGLISFKAVLVDQINPLIANKTCSKVVSTVDESKTEWAEGVMVPKGAGVVGVY